MGNLFFIAAALFVLWWISKNVKHIHFPSVLDRYGKMTVGVILLLAGLALMARGQFIPAAIAAFCAASLLGWKSKKLFGAAEASRISRFQSPMVDLEMDNLTGHMDGIVKILPYRGKRLSELDKNALQTLLNESLKRRDTSSEGLLQAYIYRRFSAGSEHTHGNSDTGARGRSNASSIAEQEAYDILGLEPGATTDEIKLAYRSLMKKLHPDQGGTAYLAARINEARDVLLNRHR